MGKDNAFFGPAFSTAQQPAIRFLVESALRKIKSTKESRVPRSEDDWVRRLTEALISDAETSHRAVIASLMANGIRTEDVFERFVPNAARLLGELWVKDEISFVDVTVGAARLQALYRERPDSTLPGFDRTIPLGQSILMVIPSFEHHALGAFIAADQFRRHGLWVHMGIGLTGEEISDLLRTRSFSLLGISTATWSTLDKTADLVDYLRSSLDHVPPIVVGGRVVTDPDRVIERTGADYAFRTAREAVEKCGLSTVGTALTAGELC